MQSRSLIAVVDDDESVRRALVRLLRSADFDAVAFPSAAEFLSACPEMPIECVVLDLQMPGMTGLDLQQHLQTAFPDCAIPVVMITAHDEPEGSEKSIGARVAAYLRKPVEGSVLLGEVRRAIARPRQ